MDTRRLHDINCGTPVRVHGDTVKVLNDRNVATQPKTVQIPTIDIKNHDMNRNTSLSDLKL